MNDPDGMAKLEAFASRLSDRADDFNDKLYGTDDLSDEELDALIDGKQSPCQNCGSDRIFDINTHGKDMNDWRFQGGKWNEGYLPYIDGFCGGDDATFAICLECGQVQGNWPKEIDDD